jgi:hypothetical protein
MHRREDSAHGGYDVIGMSLVVMVTLPASQLVLFSDSFVFPLMDGLNSKCDYALCPDFNRFTDRQTDTSICKHYG